uniref:Cation/H+ exchanger transmembrane domain-containing protein n=1 Tax=Glycine max TaxID=3847 RepID=A0A0R0K9Y8_SOYBN
MFVLLIPFATHSEKPCVSDVDYDLCHFLLLCVAPFTYPVDREITDKNEWDNYKLSYVFIGIMFCAHITEMLGTHSIVGALVFGLILPREKFVDMLMERSDDLVSTYLEPLLFIGCGVRFDFTTFKKRKLRDAMIITLLSCCTKIVSTVIATGFYRMPFRDGVALGELLNTKGLLPLVMLNILQVTDCVVTGIVGATNDDIMQCYFSGRGQIWERSKGEKDHCSWKLSPAAAAPERNMNMILSRDLYTIMVTANVLMTILVSPIINYIYKPRKRFEKDKLRTIQNLRADADIPLILLPFHKHSTVEGINQNVMHHAPCSVGILVDRGHGWLSKVSLRVCIVFIGGPDDREAPGDSSLVGACSFAVEVDTNATTNDEANGILSTVIDSGKEKELDEEYLDRGSYDLYILGHGKGRNFLVLSNLMDWTDCPELGVIGDMLASNSFGYCSSVLVVQQYGFGGMNFKASNQATSSKHGDVDALFGKGVSSINVGDW